MGTLHAMDMAANADLDVALHWHLRSNHFPPVHEVFIPVAKQAIEVAVAANLIEEFEMLDEEVELPNGAIATLSNVVEGLHLHAFVDQGIAEALQEWNEDE